MPDLLPPDLVTLRDRVIALADDVLVGLRDDVSLREDERRRRTVEASKAAGVYGMTQPVEYGGTPSSALALVVVRDTLGAHGVGHLPGVFGPGPGPLAGVGEPLRSSHLGPMLAGERRGGFAITEPRDAPRHTWARREGDELVINGQKSYVTGGAEVDFLTALVDVEGRGRAMVVIDTTSPGVTLTRRFATLDGSHHAAFEFRDVRVPAVHLLGDAPQGGSRALATVSNVRLGITADCAGTARWAVGLVHDHLLAPRRDGTPLAGSDRARLRYGQLRTEAYAVRSVAYRTARVVDSGENAVNEVMAAKLFATEAAGRVVDAAIQVIGGEALVEGHPLEAAARRLRTVRLAEGESDTLAVNIARGALDLGKGRL